MTARIFDRPDLDQDVAQPALYVTGRFARAKPSLAYEGRLQIRNAIGACSVLQIDGDRLPEGSQLRVDQASKEVVVAWPAFQSAQAPIINPGFEDGPTGWDTGPGWVIAKENPPTGQWAAGYNNNPGMSRISSASRYTIQPGQLTMAKCNVRQGASSEGNAGASIMLEYRNLAGDVVHTIEGNQVMSASKNRVYPSTVLGAAPASGAATINVACNGIRHRENKILFVDDVEWDHTVPAAGINIETVLNVTLRVNDSTGRSFVWSGQIMVALRPIMYRYFGSFSPAFFSSYGYRHASGAIDSFGSVNNSGRGNNYLVGVSDDGLMGAVTYTGAPGFSVYPITAAGEILPAFDTVSPPLPGTGRCAAFSRSGRAVIVGHLGSPFVRAHEVSSSGIGAAYAPPSDLPGGSIVDVIFNPVGDIVYLASASGPSIVAYRWSDATGFGERLDNPLVALPPSVTAMSINESGTHLAAIGGSNPSCRIYKIGPSGLEELTAAVGTTASGRVAISDAAKAVVFGGTVDPAMNLYFWDAVSGLGAPYPIPTGLNGANLARGSSFSKDGLVLFVGVSSNRGVSIYEWLPGVGVTSGPVSAGGTACAMTIPID